MHPKLAEFLKQAYTVVQPCSYAELLKLVGGLAHGTGTWKNNGEDLLKNSKCRLAGIPATRDEVFMLIRDVMREHGVYYDTGFAYDIANKTRKGFYVENGMDGYTIDTLKALGFDDCFASYLLGVRYMSTKALSVMELHYIILLTWYQTYYPKQYAEVIGEETIWEGDT
jgi:DNA polymerase III alpha subunit (gram-positive type)